MQIKSQRDFCAGLLFVVVGVAFAVGASNYALGSSEKPGAGYFPLILSVLMAVLGGIVLFKSLTIETEGGDPIGDVAWRPLVVIIGAVVVFGLTIESLGLLIAVPLLVLISSFAGREFKWVSTVAACAVLTFLAWLILAHGMKLAIPLLPSVAGG